MICLLLVKWKSKEVNEKTSSAVDGALLQTRKTVIQYIKAILLERNLVDNKEQPRLEMHFDFNHDDIMKEFIVILLYS